MECPPFHPTRFLLCSPIQQTTATALPPLRFHSTGASLRALNPCRSSVRRREHPAHHGPGSVEPAARRCPAAAAVSQGAMPARFGHHARLPLALAHPGSAPYLAGLPTDCSRGRELRGEWAVAAAHGGGGSGAERKLAAPLSAPTCPQRVLSAAPSHPSRSRCFDLLLQACHAMPSAGAAAALLRAAGGGAEQQARH